MRTVRIYGTAPNIRKTPPVPPNSGQEVWLANSPTTFEKRFPRALGEWTHWFNLHSRAWMLQTYPNGYAYLSHEAQGRPVYLQKAQPDIASSVKFPRKEIQEYFKTPNGKPNRYFTSSVCWLIALAIWQGFKRIELWGFKLSINKRRSGVCYAFERPAFFYWIQQARDRGIVVVYQREIERLPFEPGDPESYTGPLYGYATKPEPDWNAETEDWFTGD